MTSKIIWSTVIQLQIDYVTNLGSSPTKGQSKASDTGFSKVSTLRAFCHTWVSSIRSGDGIRADSLVEFPPASVTGMDDSSSAIKAALIASQRLRGPSNTSPPWESLRREFPIVHGQKRLGKLRPPKLLRTFLQCTVWSHIFRFSANSGLIVLRVITFLSYLTQEL